ncbi:FtsX-like permease family protein [Pseudoalteromonas tunicata]|uniref:Putative ABC transporter, permease protein n=1 Tax=Pseudoalteromonas tunicata D2 TaxID=87626 RepID=A4CDX0_9GAMM|nr:FtsX-like permease family protein [Pseudoalteromonas tunicata]ATC96345.1 hypothetical protein PTUN_a4129 [Pseudoalteromonas tunicata]AXT31844.1 hypothetical protein D1819_14155 [Pseudoalteromonas tunicata]EAR27162.1 putative ABC transporter, permease protein [Pseudoalteromonas tunicata D2]
MSFYLRALRYGIIRLVSLPRFSLPILVTLSLTLATVMTAVAISSNVLFQPLPDIKDEHTLYKVSTSKKLNDKFTFPILGSNLFLHLKAHYASQGQWAYFKPSAQSITVAEQHYAVTQFDAFQGTEQILGTRLVLGENSKASASIKERVWISETLWHQVFASDPEIVGKQLNLDAQPYLIQGVLQDFTSNSYGDKHGRQQIWRFDDLSTPIATNMPDAIRNNETFFLLLSTLPALDTNQLIEVVNQGIAEGDFINKFPVPTTATIELYRDNLVGKNKVMILLLLSAFVGLLLMACCNLINVFIAHYQGRHKEFAISKSLGANKLKLINQIFIESAPLFISAGVLGLLGAAWIIKLLPIIFNKELPLLHSISVNQTTYLFAIISLLLMNLVFSLLCFFHLPLKHLNQALQGSGKGVAKSGSSRLQKGLFVVQLCIASTLLVSLAMISHQSYQTLYPHLGYQLKNTLLMTVKLKQDGAQQTSNELNSEELTRTSQLAQELSNHLQQNLTQLEILQGRGEPLGLTNIFHFSKHPVTQADLSYQSSQLTPDFLSAFDIPLIAGRNISEQEWKDKAKIMLINENLAQLLSPDQPIESLLNTEFEKATIIGIVGNTFNLMTRNKLQAISYQHLNYQTQQEIKLLMQLPAGEAFATQTLQQLALAFDPSIDQVEMRTLNEYWNAATADTRMLFYFTNLLTLLTLALAAIGMAGLATSLTEQKRFELAIRMATGASRNQLLRLVLAQASWLLFSGLCAGIIFATLVYTSLQPKITSLPAFDLMPIILIDLLLIIIVLIATLWPAKRIINRAPMQALRDL